MLAGYKLTNLADKRGPNLILLLICDSDLFSFFSHDSETERTMIGRQEFANLIDKCEDASNKALFCLLALLTDCDQTTALLFY